MFGVGNKPGVAPPMEIETSALPDGRSTFQLTRYMVGDVANDQEATRVIFVNGLFENRAIWRGLATRLAAVAFERGHALEMIAYDEPQTGLTAYAQSYRTERLEQVASHAQSLDVHDRPVTLKAHSRGWVTSIQAGARLVKAELINGVLGTAVAGHSSMPASEVTSGRVAEMCKLELARSVRVGATQEGIELLRAFARNATLHLLFGGSGSFNEIKDLLTSDITAKAVKVSKRTPTEVWALRDDPFCPGDRVVACLRRNGFRGRIVETDTMHNGPFVDVKLTQPLYESIVSLTRR
jgi:pimeloyl-ACP methyl ester carboxylesterase